MPKVYRFEEPDMSRDKWTSIREALKENVGQWALVLDGTQGDTVKDVASMRSMFKRANGYAIRVRNKLEEPLRAWMKYDPENVKPMGKRGRPRLEAE